LHENKTGKSSVKDTSSFSFYREMLYHEFLLSRRN